MRHLEIEKQITHFLTSLNHRELEYLKDIDNMNILYNRFNYAYGNTFVLFYMKIISIYVAIHTTIEINNNQQFMDIDSLFLDIYDTKQKKYTSRSEKSNTFIKSYLQNNYTTFQEYLLSIFMYFKQSPIHYTNYMKPIHDILCSIKIHYKDTYTKLKQIYMTIFVESPNTLYINPEITEDKIDVLLEECRQIITIFYIQFDTFKCLFDKTYKLLQKDITFEVTKLRIEHLSYIAN